MPTKEEISKQWLDAIETNVNNQTANTKPAVSLSRNEKIQLLIPVMKKLRNDGYSNQEAADILNNADPTLKIKESCVRRHTSKKRGDKKAGKQKSKPVTPVSEATTAG